MTMDALVGSHTNPRFLLWNLWHGDSPSMRNHDFIVWITARWTDYRKETGDARPILDHEAFDAWLRRWVRNEIAHKVKQASLF